MSEATQEVYDDLVDAHREVEHAMTRLRQAVDVARSLDLEGRPLLSWAWIGDALGVSRQAAQQRFGRV